VTCLQNRRSGVRVPPPVPLLHHPAPWHRLTFCPLPHGHASLRPARDSMDEGYTGTLDKLAEYLAKV